MVSSAPSGLPSRRNCTPTTPVLSLAFADTVTVAFTVDPSAGAVNATVGGDVSEDPPDALNATTCKTQLRPFWVAVAE